MRAIMCGLGTKHCISEPAILAVTIERESLLLT